MKSKWPWRKTNIRENSVGTVCDLESTRIGDDNSFTVAECLWVEDAEVILQAMRKYVKFFPQRSLGKKKSAAKTR
ncbi:MAG: hypothetical protein ABSE63_11710 [Thermoguttaceae bacterium]|jgi:hypothetical protein